MRSNSSVGDRFLEGLIAGGTSPASVILLGLVFCALVVLVMRAIAERRTRSIEQSEDRRHRADPNDERRSPATADEDDEGPRRAA